MVRQSADAELPGRVARQSANADSSAGKPRSASATLAGRSLSLQLQTPEDIVRPAPRAPRPAPRLPPDHTDPEDRPQDLPPRPQRPGHRPGNLRDADSFPVRNRHLGVTHSGPRGLDLHLCGPAEVPVGHLEPIEGLPADRTERPQVGHLETVEPPDQPRGQRIAEPRLRQQRTGLPVTESPRSDDELRTSRENRRHDLGQLLGMIAEIAIDEHDDLGGRLPPGQLGHAGETGTPVTPAVFLNHRRPVRRGDPRSLVGRGVVDDDDLPQQRGRQRIQNLPDRTCLVEGGNDHVDKRGSRHGLGWPMIADAMIQADSELQFVKGVGPRRAQELSRQGLETVEDLLYQLPFRYEDRRSFAEVGQLAQRRDACTLSVRIESARLIRTRRRGFTIFEAQVADDTGSIRCVWYNQPFLQRVIVAGRRAVLYGKAAPDRYRKLSIENPDYEILDEDETESVHTGRIVPVDRKTADLSPRVLRQLIHRLVLETDPASMPDLVPDDVRERLGLLRRFEALRQVHFPEEAARIDELAGSTTLAQRTLAFEEIFLLQLALALRKDELRHEARGIVYKVPDDLMPRLEALLPFTLTGAQRRVLGEISADLAADHPMNRLLQGDVGSGKTVVALLTLMVAIENGYQAALMAPTEILAEQHYRTISGLLQQDRVFHGTTLLTGSMRAAPRRLALERIASGEAKLVIGTHALFEGGVDFHKLGVVVVDEQHRFGVMQRAALARKGNRPDVLVMTATPIPRSLALTLYGDLDLSVIDELPPGRTPIRTVVRGEADRPKVWSGVRKETAAGRQVYIVVPLVEETEKTDLKAAEAFARELREKVFPDLGVGMVHGRMKGPDKDAAMQAFIAGKTRILVATTVIEVGVDVSNASVMVIEHAERFGLSQLHQLRGRVGRGAARSFCILMSGEEAGGDARERLRIMEETNDGFQIAERDLEIRGPGAVFGTQQHGLSDLQFLALVLRSPALLDAARGEAERYMSRGGNARDEATQLLESLRGRWARRLELARVG